jgi:hypothetical protein
MRKGHLYLLLGSLITVGALVLADTFFMPAAKATWSTTREVSAVGWEGQDFPTVAVDRQGDRLFAWAARDSAVAGPFHQIQTRIMPYGGAMGTIRTLSPFGPVALWPEVDVDDDGDGAVVWQADSRVLARRVSRSGTLGTLRTLSPEIPARGANPNVVVSPDGRALVAWADSRTGQWQTMAQFINLDGTLGTLHNLGSSTGDKPAMGIDRNGVAVVAWVHGDGRVVARRIKPGYVSPLTTFASPTAEVGYGMVRVAVDRDGDAVVTLRSGGDLGFRSQVFVRRWTRTGTVGGLRVFSGSDAVGFHHAVASDLEGDCVLVWTRWNSAANQTELVGRRMSRTGELGSPVVLGLGDLPDVALDDDGHGLVVWHSPGAQQDPTQVKARTISTAGSFGSARTLSSDGKTPRVDASPTGRFAVVWQQRHYPYQIRAQFGP